MYIIRGTLSLWGSVIPATESVLHVDITDFKSWIGRYEHILVHKLGMKYDETTYRMAINERHNVLLNSA